MSDLKVSLVLALKNLLGRGIGQVRGELRGLKDEAKGLAGIKGPNAAGLAAYGVEARRSALALRELKRTQAVLGAGRSGSTILPATGAAARSIGGLGVGLLTGAIGTAVAALQLKEAAKVAAENERAMTRIAVTGDASKNQQVQAAQDIERLAFKTAQSAKDIREGLDSLVAAGRSLPDAMKFLPTVANTAQASGAAVLDIAKSADAVSGSMEVAADKMETAFDIMATGGKLGKFELKDMAQYLPELAPMAKEVGMKGTEGLTSLVAALQMVRKETGTSSEAATNLKNVFSKMFSGETEKKFEKMDIDLPKAMEKAKKEGKNLLDTFVDLTMLATKGDMTKLPKLFEDMQAQAGMRALINNRKAMAEMVTEIGKTSSGAVGRDLQRVLGDTQTAMDRVSGSASRVGKNIGNIINASRAASGVLDGVAGGLNKINEAMERSGEIQRKLDQAGIKPIPEAKSKATADADKAIEDAKAAKETAERIAESEKNYPDGGFHRGSTNGRKKAGSPHPADIAARDAESRRLAARDPSARAKEAEDIAKEEGAYGEALTYANNQRGQQRSAGDTNETVNARIDAADGRVRTLLSAIQRLQSAPNASSPGTRAKLSGYENKLREAVVERETQTRRLSGGTVPAAAEIDAIIQKLREIPPSANEAGNAVKDKLTLDLTSQGAASALSWAAGLRSGIPAVMAAAAQLRAPIMTPAAAIPGATGGRPTSGGGARAPGGPATVQVGGITVNGVNDPEKTARIVEQRLASAIRSSLSGAHHDGVT